MAAVFERLRVPLGSLVVDGAMVLYLAFISGQTLNRFEAMDTRLAAVERTAVDEKLAQRTAILEQRIEVNERERRETRAEILDSLRRIENKLDSKQDKVGK